MSAAEDRRLVLIRWMRERIEHRGLTATEIVDLGDLYTGHGRYDRCFDDLKVFERRGVVERAPGRPARWWPT